MRLALQLRLGELCSRGEGAGELGRLADLLGQGADDPEADHGALLRSAAAVWAGTQPAAAPDRSAGGLR